MEKVTEGLEESYQALHTSYQALHTRSKADADLRELEPPKKNLQETSVSPEIMFEVFLADIHGELIE